MVLPLSKINPGSAGKIEFLGNHELMAGRLQDLGFTSGAVVSCVMKRPKGNIAAYLVRNAVIALREEDSRLIFVQEYAAAPCGDHPSTVNAEAEA